MFINLFATSPLSYWYVYDCDRALTGKHRIVAQDYHARYVKRNVFPWQPISEILRFAEGILCHGATTITLSNYDLWKSLPAIIITSPAWMSWYQVALFGLDQVNMSRAYSHLIEFKTRVSLNWNSYNSPHASANYLFAFSHNCATYSTTPRPHAHWHISQSSISIGTEIKAIWPVKQAFLRYFQTRYWRMISKVHWYISVKSLLGLTCQTKSLLHRVDPDTKLCQFLRMS